MVGLVLAALGGTIPATSGASGAATAPAPLSEAVWPVGPSTWAAPTEVARAFAVRYLAMPVAAVGPFRRTGPHAGAVSVRSSARGPVTTLALGQLGGEATWSILGATGTDLTIASPRRLSVVRSPLAVAGTSTAFEGVATLELRGDGLRAPLATTTVHGGSMGVVGRYRGVLRFARPRVAGGALELLTRSAKDGSIVAATVVRVRF